MKKLVLVCLALLAIAGAARAVPTVRGATGFISIPSAKVMQSASIFTRNGNVSTTGTHAFSVVEGGVLNQNGRNFYNGKIQLLPDVTTDDEWIPGVAVGLRGLSETNEQRDYYFLLQKKFTYPECTVVWGMNKIGSWKNGSWAGFYGVEVPLFMGFTVVADHENQNNVTNVGVRWVFQKTFAIYDYYEDATGKSANPKQNTIGACYQKRF